MGRVEFKMAASRNADFCALQKTHFFLLTNISLQSQCHCTGVNQYNYFSHYLNIATVCLTATVLGDVRSSGILTFRNLASYIKDGRTATLQMLHFIYLFSTNIST
jgi:hypothetical protein